VAGCVLRGKKLSTRSIVKKKRRKPQTSQDKAVATNHPRHQTSGKNQNREYFTGFCQPACLEKIKAFQIERQNWLAPPGGF
jgi:hypothetical protein